MNSEPKITKKQKELLDYIRNFIDETGYSPTYREIMAGLGYRSVATVSKHIDNLVALGVLEKSDSGEARSINLVNQKKFDDEINIVLKRLEFEKNKFAQEEDFASADILAKCIKLLKNIQ